MQPEMYLVIYHQQERELEQRLFRQMLQTCCAPIAAARRSAWAALTARLATFRLARQTAVCCPA